MESRRVSQPTSLGTNGAAITAPLSSSAHIDVREQIAKDDHVQYTCLNPTRRLVPLSPSPRLPSPCSQVLARTSLDLHIKGEGSNGRIEVVERVLDDLQ